MEIGVALRRTGRTPAERPAICIVPTAAIDIS
jgi:hypothetical protein